METNSELFRSFEIELPEDEVQDAIHRKLEKDHPTRGFRSVSKMPLSFILKKYGDLFLAEILQEMLTLRMNAEVSAKNYDVAGAPTIIGKWSIHDRPLRYRYLVEFEVYPKFDVQGLDTLKINAPARTIVDDSHVDACMHMVQQERSTWKEVDRPARRGDRMIINFDSFLEDGQPFAGGTADNVVIGLGSGGLLPEFENALIGAKAGQSLDFPVSFPEDYGSPSLAGKTACFSVTVVSVREFELVPMDDALAVQCGAENLAALRESTRAHLQQQHDEQDERDIASDLLRQLAVANPIPLPPRLVSQQLRNLQREAMVARGMSLEQVQIDDSLTDQAQWRVQLAIVARQLVIQEQIPIDAQADFTEQVIAWLKEFVAANNCMAPPAPVS